MIYPERKLNRKSGHDYSTTSWYFITICIKDQKHWFGYIHNNKMVLNDVGKIVENQWLWLFNQYNYIDMDEFNVMPNHFHGLIKINNPTVGTGRDLSLQEVHINNQKIKPLSELIGAFKTTSSKLIHLFGEEAFAWQRSFHDIIVHDDFALEQIRDYIKFNPYRG